MHFLDIAYAIVHTVSNWHEGSSPFRLRDDLWHQCLLRWIFSYFISPLPVKTLARTRATLSNSSSPLVRHRELRLRWFTQKLHCSGNTWLPWRLLVSLPHYKLCVSIVDFATSLGQTLRKLLRSSTDRLNLWLWHRIAWWFRLFTALIVKKRGFP